MRTGLLIKLKSLADEMLDKYKSSKSIAFIVRRVYEFSTQELAISNESSFLEFNQVFQNEFYLFDDNKLL